MLPPEEPPAAIEADLLDPQTREFLSLEDSADPIDAHVQYTFGIKRGSGAAVRAVGHRFDEARHVSPELPIELDALTREAVQHLESQGLLRTEKVEIRAADGEAGDDWAESHYHYRDLTTGEVASRPLR